MKDGTRFEIGFHPNFTAMPLHDALADCEADTRTWNFLSVQPLEDSENPVVILRRDADAVVSDRKKPVLPFLLGRHVYVQRSLAAILDRVADQVLEELDQGAALQPDVRQGVMGNGGSALLDRGRQRE